MALRDFIGQPIVLTGPNTGHENVVLLEVAEEGVLVDAGTHFRFVPWHQVTRMALPKPQVPKEGAPQLPAGQRNQ